MKRLGRALLLLAGLASLAACSVFGGAAAPEPEHRVIVRDGDFEVRDYGALVVARTGMADGSRAAFGRLFDYISGANAGRSDIAMTAPVLETGSGEGRRIAMTAPVLQSGQAAREMIFVLPSDLSPDTAPVPTDPAVTLATLPTRRVAVVRYPGSLEAGAAEAEDRLRTWLQGRGLVPVGPAEIAGYNPPWTLPPWRRNEVLIPITPD